MKLAPGLQGEATTVITSEKLATAEWSGGAEGVEVFGTPMMIALMEHAAWEAVKEYLDPGDVTVGTMVHIRHLAPTPPGRQVRAIATLVAVNGRQLLFQVEAYDEVQKIGEGQHGRAVVNLKRFLSLKIQSSPIS